MDSLDQLREEIQTDRIETQRIVHEGFSNLGEKLDKVIEKHADLDKRVSSVEGTQRTIIRSVTGVGSAAITAMTGWVINFFRGN